MGMRRRDFLAGVGGVAASPLAARAQPADRMRRIAVLMGLPPGIRKVNGGSGHSSRRCAISGWRNGTNVNIELRWAPAIEQMRTFAQELVGLQPDVIQVATGLATAEVLRKTSTVPLVFTVVNDPVAFGFVQRPVAPGRQCNRLYQYRPFARPEMAGGHQGGCATHHSRRSPVQPGARLAVQIPLAANGSRRAALGIAAEAIEVRNLAEFEKAVDTIGHASASWPRCHSRPLFQPDPRLSSPRWCHAIASCRDLPLPRLRGRRRARLVFCGPRRLAAPRRRLRRPHSQGRKAR